MADADASAPLPTSPTPTQATQEPRVTPPHTSLSAFDAADNGSDAGPSRAHSDAPGGSIEHGLSLESILAAVGVAAPAASTSQSTSWADQVLHAEALAGPPPPVTLSSLGKRKAVDEEEDINDRTKARRVESDEDSAPRAPARVIPMTTVVCLHAAVAQKSYSTEKRFLCPPPVIHVDGPAWQLRTQQFGMSVVSEQHERSFEQKAKLDEQMNASFKFLHVAGTGKAKSFHLSLDIADPPASPAEDEGEDEQDEEDDTPQGVPPRVWASFDSAPVTIISKPSKKTAKARNVTACILAGGPVSLFNRINSQTVRTKYMTIESSQLCASNTTWSAFNVNVVRRAGDSVPSLTMPVTYGSEVVLTDASSGISTAPLVIRKVDKGRIVHDDGGPVSQMQKIALQRYNPDGTRHYLSAAGPANGTPAHASSGNTAPSSHPLLFTSVHKRKETKNGVSTSYDEVDDALCWTIVGISKFQYTFFDAFENNKNVPKLPITPFPTLFAAPLYQPQTNTLELAAANFFYEDPDTHTQKPLEVYLGHLGPLRTQIHHNPPSAAMGALQRFTTLAQGHCLVFVRLPDLQDIIKAVDEDLPKAALGDATSEPERAQDVGEGGPESSDPPEQNTLVQPFVGRSLPLLFIRPCDGVGYHSGRSIVVENLFVQIHLHNGTPSVDPAWLRDAMGGDMGRWTVRVL